MQNIAVIIAHKDYNHFLETAIQSCINQTYSNYICVIDDGSKNPPIDIMKGFFGEPIKKDNYLFFNDKALLILSDNKGPSNARNLGIKACEGFDAYLILDADDYIFPEKIEKMKNVLKDPNIAVVYADYFIENEDGQKTMEFKHPYDIFLLNQFCIVHSGSMISSKFLNRIKENEEYYRTDMRVAEDYNLWIRLSKVGLFYHIPEFLGVSRSHKNDSTNTVPVEIWNENMNKVRN